MVQATNKRLMTEATALRGTHLDLAYAAGDYNRTPGTAGSYNVIGIDTTLDMPYCRDDGNGVIRLCTAVDSFNRPTTWSTTKGLPTGVSWFNFFKILTFAGNLYALTILDATSLPTIFRAAPTSGSTALTWSAALFTGTAGSSSTSPRGTNFTTDGTYLYYADYGDPTGGPQFYRSPDGTTWTSMATFTGTRHVHSVAVDPFNAGNVWLALGDGIANPVRYSTNSGTSWNNHSQPSQLTDFGFEANWVIGLDDSSYVTAVEMGRDGTTWQGISNGFHANVGAFAKVATATWDPASVATGAMVSTSVSFPGLINGIPLVASLGVAVPAGMILTATSTTDSATVTLLNMSGSTQDLASSTLMVSIVGLQFAPSLFFGATDTTYNVTYMLTQQGTGFPYGSLFAILRHMDAPILLDMAQIGNWPLIMWRTRLFYGKYNRPLISLQG